MDEPLFAGGENISLRVPDALFEQALDFYARTLGLVTRRVDTDTYTVCYGPLVLWLDRCKDIDRCEVRLELRTPDTKRAATHLRQAGVEQLEAEPLPDGYDGFWMRSPLGEVVLVSAPSQ